MKKIKENATSKKDFNRIILPVDGSDSSKRAVKKALNLARETGVDITALYVIEFPILPVEEYSYMYSDVLDILNKKGNDVLEKVKKQGSEIGVHVKTKLVEGIPDDQIIREAKKDDLIIMGCKGRTALSRILIGSVCEKVLHHSKSPVMMIR